MDLWEKQEYDTEASWAAFVAYRDQGPGRQLLRPQRVPYAELMAWYNAHHWKERVMAHDRHIDAIQREERENVLRLEARAVTGEQLARVRRLAALVDREVAKLEELIQDDRLPVMKRGELLKFLEHVLKAERLLRGESTERTETEISLNHLTDEELRIMVKATAAKEK